MLGATRARMRAVVLPARARVVIQLRPGRRPGVRTTHIRPLARSRVDAHPVSVEFTAASVDLPERIHFAAIFQDDALLFAEIDTSRSVMPVKQVGGQICCRSISTEERLGAFSQPSETGGN